MLALQVSEGCHDLSSEHTTTTTPVASSPTPGTHTPGTHTPGTYTPRKQCVRAVAVTHCHDDGADVARVVFQVPVHNAHCTPPQGNTRVYGTQA